MSLNSNSNAFNELCSVQLNFFTNSYHEVWFGVRLFDVVHGVPVLQKLILKLVNLVAMDSR